MRLLLSGGLSFLCLRGSCDLLPGSLFQQLVYLVQEALSVEGLGNVAVGAYLGALNFVEGFEVTGQQ